MMRALVGMKHIRRLVPILAIALALLPSSAIASTTYEESVLGVETGNPTPCGGTDSLSSFAGIASGTIDGVFQIAVCHTPLSLAVATIKSGTFVLRDDETTVLGGFASGGLVSPISASPLTGFFCTQTFGVSGGLTPRGHFAGVLVHYGYVVAGSCNVKFATISGNATLTFP